MLGGLQASERLHQLIVLLHEKESLTRCRVWVRKSLSYNIFRSSFNTSLAVLYLWFAASLCRNYRSRRRSLRRQTSWRDFFHSDSYTALGKQVFIVIVWWLQITRFIGTQSWSFCSSNSWRLWANVSITNRETTWITWFLRTWASFSSLWLSCWVCFVPISDEFVLQSCSKVW